MIAVGPQVATVMTPQALRHGQLSQPDFLAIQADNMRRVRRTRGKILLPISAASSPASTWLAGLTASVPGKVLPVADVVSAEPLSWYKCKSDGDSTGRANLRAAKLLP
jgi:hypothetical protein